MEDEENDLENIFEEYETNHGDNEENPDNNEGGNVPEASETRERVAVPKRAVKNPRLKFNAERLCGTRGIPVVTDHFKNVKFKGKGHEVEDLNKLLATLEHWCHRLYPSMKFGDCLRQVEKLGKKRPVQTCLRKIRLDMPILDNDFVHDEEEKPDNEEIENELDVEVPQQDAFDRLLNETSSASYEPFASTPVLTKTATTGHTLGTFSNTLTEEQKKRMEYNKLLATERRKARLAAVHSAEESSVDQSADLFGNSEASTLLITDRDADDINESSQIDSLSLLAPPSMEPHSNPETEESEALGLDDLIDLVDEEDADDPKQANADWQSSSSQVSKEINVVDITDNDDNDYSNISRRVEVVDLDEENIANSNLSRNQDVEVVRLGEEQEINNSVIDSDEVSVLDEICEVLKSKEGDAIDSMDVD